MRKLIVPAIAGFMMASPLAMAQQAQDAPASPPSQSGQTAAQGGASQPAGARSYDAVQSSLENAGIQNVKVLDAAYLVRATTKDGEQVSLVVEPPTAGAASSGGSAGGSSASANANAGAGAGGGQEAIRQALTDAGFQDIRFVDASYLAQAQTKDGDQITMMIDPSMSGGGSQSASGDGSGGGSSAPSGAPSGASSGATPGATPGSGTTD